MHEIYIFNWHVKKNDVIVLTIVKRRVKKMHKLSTQTASAMPEIVKAQRIRRYEIFGRA